jgi:putative iron-only hydrogenase system regulator
MDKKIAVVAIIVSDPNAVNDVNALLHDYRDFIVGRMGLPHQRDNLSVISVVLDASLETVNSLSGKLGMIKGISSKVLTTK